MTQKKRRIPSRSSEVLGSSWLPASASADRWLHSWHQLRIVNQHLRSGNQKKKKKTPKFVFPKISYSQLRFSITYRWSRRGGKEETWSNLITFFGRFPRSSSQYRCCLPHLPLPPHLLAACRICCCSCLLAAAAAVVGGFHIVAVEVGGYKKTHSRKFGVLMIIS